MTQVAELMVRDGMSFKEAVNELHLPLTPGECDAVKNRAVFQDILLKAQHTHRESLANMPERSKASAIGLALLSLEKLFQEGEWREVIAGVEKIGKMEGWIGGETNINVFSGLTQTDIKKAKERIAQQLVESGPTPKESPIN
jgi:hypothetical protein